MNLSQYIKSKASLYRASEMLKHKRKLLSKITKEYSDTCEEVTDLTNSIFALEHVLGDKVNRANPIGFICNNLVDILFIVGGNSIIFLVGFLLNS